MEAPAAGQMEVPVVGAAEVPAVGTAAEAKEAQLEPSLADDATGSASDEDSSELEAKGEVQAGKIEE